MSTTSDICCEPVNAGVLDEDEAADLANVLKAVADPVRLRLLNLIANNVEVCACDLPAAVDRSQPTVSHHLTVLVNAGLITRDKRGKWAWFRVCPARLDALRIFFSLTSD